MDEMGEYLESTAPDGTVRRYAIQSVADALAEARHGTCRECGSPWPVVDGDPVERCPGCDCPFWVTTHG